MNYPAKSHTCRKCNYRVVMEYTTGQTKFGPVVTTESLRALHSVAHCPTVDTGYICRTCNTNLIAEPA